MASPLLPPSFWGLDGLIDSFPKFYIQDLLEMPEMESHTGWWINYLITVSILQRINDHSDFIIDFVFGYQIFKSRSGFTCL